MEENPDEAEENPDETEENPDEAGRIVLPTERWYNIYSYVLCG